jgi:hypothetical protein
MNVHETSQCSTMLKNGCECRNGQGKIYTGSTLDQHRVNTGSTLDQHRLNTASTLGQHLANTGSTPDQHLINTGSTLGQHCINSMRHTTLGQHERQLNTVATVVTRTERHQFNRTAYGSASSLCATHTCDMVKQIPAYGVHVTVTATAVYRGLSTRLSRREPLRIAGAMLPNRVRMTGHSGRYKQS